MARYQLLKSQKNEIFEILQEAGLEPANFKWTHISLMPSVDILIPRLNYPDGKYYFEFRFYDQTNEFWCKFSPGKNHVVEGQKSEVWGEQIFNFRSWITYLKREIEAPNLWAEMEKYKTSVSLVIPEQLLNEPIPAYEAEKINEQLSSLADRIEEQFELTSEQNQFVRSKLNYLTEAAKRQRSVDWVHTSIGVLITIAMGLTLAPDQAKELWELMKSIVGPFIHLIGP